MLGRMYFRLRSVFNKLRLYFIYRFEGIEGVSRFIFTCENPAKVLAKFGAKIGQNTSVGNFLVLHNAAGDYSNLTIGSNVHVGKNCLFDLADRIEIGDNAVVAMKTSLITHLNVGESPLKTAYPARTGPVRIESGAVVMTGVTVRHGVTIGRKSLVGAGAVVISDIPPDSLAVGVPARVVPRKP